MNGVLHVLAFTPTKLACLAEQRVLLYRQPRAFAHPVAPVALLCLRLLTDILQCFKSIGQAIPQLMGGGSCMGNSWRCLLYSFSHRLPAQIITMMAWRSES